MRERERESERERERESPMSAEKGWLLYEGGGRPKGEYTCGSQSRMAAEKDEDSRVFNTKQERDEKGRKGRKVKGKGKREKRRRKQEKRGD
jgi:hypothetical protein